MVSHDYCCCVRDNNKKKTKMNQDVIKIRCPHCGAQLSVKNQPGIESKSVTCPICKQKSPFLAFRQVNVQNDPGTDLPGSNSQGQGVRSDNTQLGDRPTDLNQNAAQNRASKLLLGRLTVVNNGQTFLLRPGRNVIGRKAQASSANFQIDTGEGRRMSREHIVIDVQRVGSEYMHTASLYKERVNETFVNTDRMTIDDGLILKHGDILHLPDADVKFTIDDGERTQL